MATSVISSTTKDVGDETTDDEEPYHVEKVLEKRFHPQRQQYEFLVKWKGYIDDENTWELASNIPDKKLQDFEQKLEKSTST